MNATSQGMNSSSVPAAGGDWLARAVGGSVCFRGGSLGEGVPDHLAHLLLGGIAEILIDEPAEKHAFSVA